MFQMEERPPKGRCVVADGVVRTECGSCLSSPRRTPIAFGRVKDVMRAASGVLEGRECWGCCWRVLVRVSHVTRSRGGTSTARHVGPGYSDTNRRQLAGFSRS